MNQLQIAIRVFIVSLLLSVTSFAQTFPVESAWVPVTRGGITITDPLGDAQNSRDIVGDGTRPAAYIARDTNYIFFRLRVNADPKQTASNFAAFGWGVALDTDGNSDHFEYLIMLNGVNNPDDVSLSRNNPLGNNGDARDRAEQDLEFFNVATHARSDAAASTFSNNADFFVSWGIPVRALSDAGVPLTTAIRMIFGTSNSAQTLGADLLAVDASELISEIISDPISCNGTSCASCDDACGENCEICGGATPICDEEVGGCVAAPCVGDSDCPPESPICLGSGVCGECSAQNQALCTGNRPVCNVGSGLCEGCAADQDCADPDLPVCLPSGACGECSADNDSLCVGSTPRCDVSLGACAGCAEDAHCAGPI
nr:hypothetical protein [Myxococcota bacterium]